jgi:hypothetical protein
VGVPNLVISSIMPLHCCKVHCHQLVRFEFFSYLRHKVSRKVWSKIQSLI